MSLSEQYRPKLLRDCVGESARTLEKLLKTEKCSHILLTGPPGTGKTTLAHCIANELLGDQKKHNFLELNASAERGIETVRTKILGFSKLIPLGVDKKIILLDEADSITFQAQQALRRPLEQYEGTVLFIFTANYREKIHDAIASRCVADIIVTLSEDMIFERLEFIAQSEKISFDRADFEEAIKYWGTDLRKLVGALEVFNAIGKIERPEFLPAWELLVKSDWKGASKLLAPEMISPMFEYVCRNYKPVLVAELALCFSKYDFQLASFSTNPRIQLQAFAIESSKIIKENL